MNLTEGTILSGRYALTARIAVGGMGEVWAATDTVLDRAVAVKLLRPGLSQDSDFAERFRAEARHTAALHHPNIATVFDFGEDDGTAYLVMELVAGQPLSQIIAERAPLSAQETASILAQAATGLEAAHQGGVVHRDVKPANILITPDGTAKLTDFGISRLVDAAPLTQTGQVLGTAQYLAPEQAMGQSATASSDVYSLGVVGYEMLTGRRPFEADTVVATALAHINRPAPSLPDTVPAGVREVISAALAKDPADRPASAAAVAHSLGMPGVASTTQAGSAPTTPTQAMATQAMATQATATATQATATQAMATQAMAAPPTLALPTQPNGIPEAPARKRRGRLVVLLAVATVIAVFVVVAVSAMSGGRDTPGLQRPSATVSTPTSTRTPSRAATAVTPPVATSVPSQKPTSGKGRDNGKKKGKP